MKQYTVFVIQEFQARGGWDDVLTADNEARSWDSLEEAKEIAKGEVALNSIYATSHVVDLHTGKVVVGYHFDMLEERVEADL